MVREGEKEKVNGEETGGVGGPAVAYPRVVDFKVYVG